MMPRSEQLAEIARDPLDLLIAGGGIVGAGIARDAALRGLRVAVIDRHDFAFGTSSRSSRLLHGGLRYLAQGRLRLVREASAEKMILRRIAPHLAQPLKFVFPTYRGSRWKRWKLGIGVKLYDLLSGGKNLGRSSSLKPADIQSLLPGINTSDLTGGVHYFDGFTQDARLVIDTLGSASKAGALALNYCGLASAHRSDSQWICGLEDIAAGSRLEVGARVVINAAGPWGENFAASRVRLRLTKGVHLVIDRSRLAVPCAVVMTDGPRILFAIPWGDRTILGTTDTDYHGPIDSPACEPADVDCILGIVNRTFPSARLQPGDIRSAWAGLRPLVADPGGRPSEISRAHEITLTEPGWIDVTGGKLTTYRLMAEQAVDRAVDALGIRAAPCATARTPLLEGLESSVAYSATTPPEVSEAAVKHFCQNEAAIHLDDIMFRRSGWHYYHGRLPEQAQRVCRWMREALRWDEATEARELNRFVQMTSGLAPCWIAPEPDRNSST